jgi:preprotein translocase subunit SecD
VIVIVEILSTLGVASLVGVTLDLSAIAGLLASVGTSLDDQIIITDEVLSGEEKEKSIKRRIKNAFFVVVSAFTATFVSMVPLAFAGAGILKGFAITTMIGITIGVLITRPAYARICELLFKD